MMSRRLHRPEQTWHRRYLRRHRKTRHCGVEVGKVPGVLNPPVAPQWERWVVVMVAHPCLSLTVARYCKDCTGRPFDLHKYRAVLRNIHQNQFINSDSKQRSAYYGTQSSNFLLSCDMTSRASTCSANTPSFGAFADHHSFHHFPEEGHTLTVGEDGSMRIFVFRVQLYSFLC